MAFHHVVNRTSHILMRANKYFQRDRRISEGNLRQSYPAEFISGTHPRINMFRNQIDTIVKIQMDIQI